MTDQALVAAANKAFPKAGALVDGRVVRRKVDNTSSIAATFTRYHVLPGIREVPLSVFSSNVYAAVDDAARVERLAAAMTESGEVSPLIVVVDQNGVADPYVLEGSHRAAALELMRAKALPAMVVVDLDDAVETRDNPARKAPAMRKNPSNPALQALHALRDNWGAGGDMGEPAGFLVRVGGDVYAVRLELWTDDCLMDLAKQTPAAAHRRGRALAKAWAKAHWPHTGYEELCLDGVHGATWAFDKATADEQSKTDPEKVLDLTMRQNPLMLDLVDDPFEPGFHKAASKRKALCFHGTSSKFFWSIVDNGFSFDETRKSWENTSPGVFVAFNEQATVGYAGHAVEAHGGAPLCFVLELPIKMLGIDIDDRDTHDKDRNLQSMVLGPVAAKYITGVLVPGGPDSIEWSAEIPIKDFIKDVQRGRYKNVLGLEPRGKTAGAPKTGKPTPVDPEHALLNYLVDVLNYTSLTHHLMGAAWQKLSRQVLTAILTNKLPSWRAMNARQWLKVIEGLTGEQNTEEYFDQMAEEPLYRRPFYEVANKFSTSHIDEARGIKAPVRRNPGPSHQADPAHVPDADGWLTITECSHGARRNPAARKQPAHVRGTGAHTDAKALSVFVNDTIARFNKSADAAGGIAPEPPGLPAVVVKFTTGRVNAVGVCRFHYSTFACEIHLHGGVWADLDEAERFDTIMHETAHAIDFRRYGMRNSGHGARWQHIARALGSTAEEKCSTELSAKLIAHHRSKKGLPPARPKEDVAQLGLTFDVGQHVTFPFKRKVFRGVITGRVAPTHAKVLVEGTATEAGFSISVPYDWLTRVPAPKVPGVDKPAPGESLSAWQARTGQQRP